MPRQPANKKPKTAKKVTTTSKAPIKTKEVHAEDETEAESTGLRDLEGFKTPGERLREISGSELANWPKTSNCKFYIDSEYKQVEYTLEDDESIDKVCKRVLNAIIMLV